MGEKRRESRRIRERVRLELPELFALRVGRSTFPVLWSILGSVLYVAVIGFMTRRP